jgi:hypothetical protein
MHRWFTDAPFGEFGFLISRSLYSRLLKGFMGVDILLTSEWPTDVAKHSSNQPDKMVTGSKKVFCF